MIVPADDIAEITGYVRWSAQIVWLRKEGWRFTVNRLGRPVVAVAEFEKRMVSGSTRGAAKAEQEVNVEGING